MNQVSDSSTLLPYMTYFNVIVGSVVFALVHLFVAIAMFGKRNSP